MTFQLDENSLMISGYKGDSASFTFNFDRDISDSTVVFLIKKNFSDSEDNAVIKKEFANSSNNFVQLNLTEEDTLKLGTPSATYRDYYWSLKIKVGGELVQTLVPDEFGSNPVFRVYP